MVAVNVGPCTRHAAGVDGQECVARNSWREYAPMNSVLLQPFGQLLVLIQSFNHICLSQKSLLEL